MDLLGLTTYGGFTPDQQQQMKDAVGQAKNKLQEPGCCAGPKTQPLQEFFEKATFVFDSTLNDCGSVSGWGFLTNTIKIGPAAFGSGCACSLAALLTHEVNHLTWGNFVRPPGRSRERPSYDLEADCFGCPNVFPLFFPPGVPPPGMIFGGP